MIIDNLFVAAAGIVLAVIIVKAWKMMNEDRLKKELKHWKALAITRIETLEEDKIYYMRMPDLNNEALNHVAQAIRHEVRQFGVSFIISNAECREITQKAIDKFDWKIIKPK